MFILARKSARLLEIFLYVHFFTTDLIIVFITARDFSWKFKWRYARRLSRPAPSARSVLLPIPVILARAEPAEIPHANRPLSRALPESVSKSAVGKEF